MRITKFVHSCLLVETPGRVALFDPGNFSWDSGTFNISKLEQLDDIIITHEHADHFHMPFVHALVEAFPHVHITTTKPIAEQLAETGIAAHTGDTDAVIRFEAPHETIEPLGTTPVNQGVHYLDTLTHPGDSHSFAETKDILALPVTAPWGTTPRAIQLALELKPTTVIPIHDWHWREEARTGFYDRLESIFAEANITFLKAEDGVAMEV